MTIPTVDVADLAQFKGKQEAMFGFFAPEALAQATFLIELMADIDDINENDPKAVKLFKFAVSELAYEMYVEQEFADVNISPFSSESIGTYSYSKSQSAMTAMSNNGAGLMWLALLRNYLAKLDDTTSTVQHGGTEGFENDGVRIDPDGNRRITSPKRDHDLYGGYGSQYSYGYNNPRDLF